MICDVQAEHRWRRPTAINRVPAIRVSGLEYRYPDGKEALRGVDSDRSAGESVALVGPNGAGKSTLLLHLNGLLPGKAADAAGHGHHRAGTASNRRRRPGPSVWIDGLEVNDRNAPEVRRRVGLVFQDPDDQLFCNTVIEDVAFGPLNLGKTHGRGAADRARLPGTGRPATTRPSVLPIT